MRLLWRRNQWNWSLWCLIFWLLYELSSGNLFLSRNLHQPVVSRLFDWLSLDELTSYLIWCCLVSQQLCSWFSAIDPFWINIFVNRREVNYRLRAWFLNRARLFPPFLHYFSIWVEAYRFFTLWELYLNFFELSFACLVKYGRCLFSAFTQTLPTRAATFLSVRLMPCCIWRIDRWQFIRLGQVYQALLMLWSLWPLRAGYTDDTMALLTLLLYTSLRLGSYWLHQESSAFQL